MSSKKPAIQTDEHDCDLKSVDPNSGLNLKQTNKHPILFSYRST
jgi:hypothetical protein